MCSSPTFFTFVTAAAPLGFSNQHMIHVFILLTPLQWYLCIASAHNTFITHIKDSQHLFMLAYA